MTNDSALASVHDVREADGDLCAGCASDEYDRTGLEIAASDMARGLDQGALSELVGERVDAHEIERLINVYGVPVQSIPEKRDMAEALARHEPLEAAKAVLRA